MHQVSFDCSEYLRPICYFCNKRDLGMCPDQWDFKQIDICIVITITFMRIFFFFLLHLSIFVNCQNEEGDACIIVRHIYTMTLNGSLIFSTETSNKHHVNFSLNYSEQFKTLTIVLDVSRNTYIQIFHRLSAHYLYILECFWLWL